MQKLILIDGNAILHRAFHALPPLSTSDGFPTNAIFGFFSMLNRVIKDFNPDYLAVAFDTPKPTFRKKLFKEYQAQRPKIKDEFKVQIPKVKEGLQKAGIKTLEKEGYEADDIIGSLIKKFEKETKIFVVSGDKDILQLCNDNVYVLQPKTGVTNLQLYTKDEVVNKISINPEQIPDLKALAGDPSDNYKGAKGIGPKTAIKLLQKFGSVENLFANLDKVEDERIRKLLEENKEQIFLAKKLATIVKDLDIPIKLEELKFTSPKEELKEFFKQYEMSSLIKRYFEEEFQQKKPEKPLQSTLF